MNSNKSNPEDFMHLDADLSRCDECHLKTEIMVKLDNNQYSSDGEYRWVMICKDCLSKATEMTL